MYPCAFCERIFPSDKDTGIHSDQGGFGEDRIRKARLGREQKLFM